VIDLHAHILPAIDDGPPTTEAALEMARTAVKAGTRAIATTSHVGYHMDVAIEQIVHGRETLAARLAYEGIDLELLAGGEVAHDRLPDLTEDELRAVTLGGGSYVLLECPFAPIGDGLEPLVDDLHVHVIDAATGELLRDLTTDTARDLRERQITAMCDSDDIPLELGRILLGHRDILPAGPSPTKAMSTKPEADPCCGFCACG